MKKKLNIIIISMMLLCSTSCVDNLLNQTPTKDLSSDLFWENADDATKALHGVYQATRTFFHKNYAWDGASDIMWANVRVPYGQYQPIASMGGNYNTHWNNGYQVVNRANYVLENVERMLQKYTEEKTQTELKRVKGELYFLRAIVYFRLTDLWKDIPFYTHILDGNNEAYTLPNVSRYEIIDNILNDLDYAKENIPINITDGERGRATRVSVYGFMGKIKLFTACWRKNEGNLSEADKLYRAATQDFAEVMKPIYGRALFRDGEPGEPTKPNYLDLFDGRNEYNTEVIFSTSNAGPSLGVGLGDTYTYDFATRSTGAGGANVTPCLRLVNKYQLLSTGDYTTPLVVSNAGDKETIPNGACNPESYKGRDYRMFATVMWDGQKMLRVSDDGMTIGPDSLIFRYNFSDNVTYINAQGPRSGYIFRKFVRQYPFGPREEGQQDIYLMRLPDVWLMYCEAVNEYNNGPTDELFDLIDKIRNRGALPELDRTKFSTKETFFRAIEQERCVELVAEGHRFFDIRRWKMIEELWPQPDGYRMTSTWGSSDWYRDEFRNASDRDIQRYYIFKIPENEVRMNPNLKQNDCWL